MKPLVDRNTHFSFSQQQMHRNLCKHQILWIIEHKASLYQHCSGKFPFQTQRKTPKGSTVYCFLFQFWPVSVCCWFSAEQADVQDFPHWCYLRALATAKAKQYSEESSAISSSSHGWEKLQKSVFSCQLRDKVQHYKLFCCKIIAISVEAAVLQQFTTSQTTKSLLVTIMEIGLVRLETFQGGWCNFL